MRARLILLFAVLVPGPVSVAQQGAAAPEVRLKTTRVQLPMVEPNMPIGGIACDGEGNVYARLLTVDASREGASIFRLPIQEITPEGILARVFRITDVSADQVSGKHIFVSSEGVVYQIAVTDQGIYVAEFAKDGSVKTKTKLQVNSVSVQPWDLAVFKAGGYLLTGETGKDGRTPFTAVFDATGYLVKNIYEPEDEAARRKAETGDSEYAPTSRGNRFVSLGATAAGSDDNIYLLRGTSPALIYAISPKGNVVRKMHIDGGGRGIARRIESYANRLAIGFDGSPAMIRVTDLTGNLIASYTVDDDDHLDLACYASQGLMFIATRAGERSYLVKAKLP